MTQTPPDNGRPRVAAPLEGLDDAGVGVRMANGVAYAVAVVRLGRRRVLVQELAAVEGLARVDVVCLDKTGTLTEGDIAVSRTVVLDHTQALTEALGALARADPSPNASLRAIASSYPAPHGWTAGARVPFSSTRKWAAATFAAKGTWLLGAPDVMLAGHVDGAARRQADDLAGDGNRVLLLARSPGPVGGVGLPASLVPVGLIVLAERLRPEASAILAYFHGQGIAVKIISGDNPATVGAIARRVGLAGGDEPLDARGLPLEPDQLADAMQSHSVFGRVSPHQKRSMVAALQARGHVVAMTGDGVNDVLALKQADIGVAMGSGTSASRAVAQLVLLDDAFEVLPAVVAEGRRVIGNVERVGKLFVTKTFFAMVLSLAVVVAGVPFPFLPRQLTIVSTLAIGIPAFFLALAAHARRARSGFVRRVLNLAVPAGVLAAASTLAGYAFARHQPQVSQAQARTAATMVLFAVSLWVLVILARPFTGWRGILVAVMGGSFLLDLAVPGLKRFYALDLPPLKVVLACLLIAATASAALETGWRIGARGDPCPGSDDAPDG